MNYLIYEKIKSNPKQYDFLNNNSYWYLLLHRRKENYLLFKKAYKNNNTKQRITQTQNIIDSIDTANLILKTLK